ncbi:uncharacterized protein LOC114661903 isoform X1 [Erpetoichthys calabaricus]|uniref:Platelet-derived growth factor subunit B n=2 Tax=Erpetoichthys calabaricus TaxID=27687 RepID=A0A8C4S9X1_ERPCA|nr:uncharacterized protein LOC114661903 isoform X1 [Erpetoichthys calabaricus]
MHLGAFFVSLSFYLTFASAESDEIPEEVFQILRSNTIHSFEDLQQLLQIDSVDEDSEAETHHNLSFNNTQSSNSSLARMTRSLGSAINVERAKLAECKVRTEVMELTRGMVDRTNANFLIWPTCVEVQRCSGCCNTRNVRCVPTRVHLRHLMVLKIEFTQGKQTRVMAVVTVEDHLECHCETSSSPNTAQGHSSQQPSTTGQLQTKHVSEHPFGENSRHLVDPSTKDHVGQHDELGSHSRHFPQPTMGSHPKLNLEPSTKHYSGQISTSLEGSHFGHWSNHSLRDHILNSSGHSKFNHSGHYSGQVSESNIRSHSGHHSDHSKGNTSGQYLDASVKQNSELNSSQINPQVFPRHPTSTTVQLPILHPNGSGQSHSRELSRPVTKQQSTSISTRQQKGAPNKSHHRPRPSPSVQRHHRQRVTPAKKPPLPKHSPVFTKRPAVSTATSAGVTQARGRRPLKKKHHKFKHMIHQSSLKNLMS